MPINASNWQELTQPGISAAFSLAYGRRPSLLQQIYNVRGSNRSNEILLPVGVAGSDGWVDFEKTGHAQAADFNRGYKWTTTHKEFARSMIVDRKLVDDNQFGDILDMASALGDSAFRFREKAAAAPFNNAFTSSGTDAFGFAIAGADAVALASASHPRSADDSGNTDSNTSNTTLTENNLSTVRRNMAGFKDDKGDILGVMADEVLVPPELEDTALKICRSAQEPGSANNAVNPQSGRYTLYTWHYLTSATNWFLMDSSMRNQSLLWYDRRPLEFFPESLNQETMKYTMVAYNRFSRGFRDWRWVYGAGS